MIYTEQDIQTATRRVHAVFAETFPSVRSDVQIDYEWDSLSAVRLVMNMERAGIAVADDDLEHLTSFAAWVIYVLTGAPPRKRMKGVITDLDGTLWANVPAEDGRQPDVSPIHSLYQTLLKIERDRGLLVGAATKNTPERASAFLNAPTNALCATDVFPISAGFFPKSEMVASILARWNITDQDVVVVDDSVLELAEIARKFPRITGLQFCPMVTPLLHVWCHRDVVTDEDRKRMLSIRSNVEYEHAKSRAADWRAFLQSVDGEMTVRRGWTERVQELVNKTNQMNLNGIRRTQEQMTQPGTLLLSVAYQDVYGDLGTIAALHGHQIANTFYVCTFAMSCRAMGRGIEHQLLNYVFNLMPDITSLSFAHRATDDNQPMTDFLHEVGKDGQAVTVAREALPLLISPHRLKVE